MQKSTQNQKHGKLVVRVVLALGIAILVLNAGQAFLVKNSAESEIEKLYEDSVSQISSIFQDDVYTTLHSYLNQLHYYTSSEVAKYGTSDEIVDWLLAHKGDRPACFNYVIFVTPDGTWHSDDGGSGNVSDRTYFKEIIGKGKDEFIDSVVVSKNNGKHIFHVTKAIKQNGQTVGFFGGIVLLDELLHLTNSIHLGKTGYAFVIDKQGYIAAHSNTDYILQKNVIGDADISADTRAFFQQALQGGEGAGFLTSIDGKKEFAVFAEVKDTPMTTIIAVEESQLKEVVEKVTSLI
ncbi:MAG: cache domain-containing protein, partial [Spirochaetaceae bacterium]|nr:cache domain-containing protein [Spirochaetaceae bacterium]